MPSIQIVSNRIQWYVLQTNVYIWNTEYCMCVCLFVGWNTHNHSVETGNINLNKTHTCSMCGYIYFHWWIIVCVRWIFFYYKLTKVYMFNWHKSILIIFLFGLDFKHKVKIEWFCYQISSGNPSYSKKLKIQRNS